MKLFITLAAIVGFASAACPNACSGHGTCNAMDHCDCYAESTDANAGKLWKGADCSLMTCPLGVSWSQPVLKADGVTLDDAAGHKRDVECSDGGICDRATGECACFAGYEGSSCQRTVCPNDCSGHGTCRSNQDFAVDFSEAVYREQVSEHSSIAGSTTSYYDYFIVTYDAAWDAGMQYGCLCDVGFRGVDCSIVECPTSFDPMDQETCEKYSEWESWGTYSSNHQSKVSSTGAKSSPSLGLQGNTVLVREWNEPTRKSAVGSQPAAVAYIPYNPIKEYPCNGAPAGDYCSGRGNCDQSSGICQCFQGFTGPACEEVADIF